MRSIMHFIAKRPFLTFVIITIGLCFIFGGATVGGWYGHAGRTVYTSCVAFVRSL
jgi:hypothetical protein